MAATRNIIRTLLNNIVAREINLGNAVQEEALEEALKRALKDERVIVSIDLKTEKYLLRILVADEKMSNATALDIPQVKAGERLLILCKDIKQMKKALDKLGMHENHENCEVFEVDAFLVDLMATRYVSPTRVLSPEDAEAYLHATNGTRAQMPKITYDDPVSRYLRARPGDILVIDRSHPLQGMQKYYRCVTDAVSHAVYSAEK